MCNAYEIGGKQGSFEGRVKAGALKALEEMEKRLIRRTDRAPVILQDGELVEMRWGFERAGLGVINNSRSDKLDGRMWRDAFAERRCLIPMSGFYEWSGPKGKKQTHRLTSRSGKLLWVAGIWEESGELGHCFSMITTEANKWMEPIHHRMPAILEGEERGDFLAGGLREFAPGEEVLQVEDAANPLVKKKGWEQGELF
ncbi:MAG: SOS response-associated peptidase [Verrucomicrobiota bacterium JB023]|nr:SOS response-associated peptidase [Verrucomicrobiota bacterium JB023]